MSTALQVSNFFERERRKAGVVIEPRRSKSTAPSAPSTSPAPPLSDGTSNATTPQRKSNAASHNATKHPAGAASPSASKENADTPAVQTRAKRVGGTAVSQEDDGDDENVAGDGYRQDDSDIQDENEAEDADNSGEDETDSFEATKAAQQAESPARVQTRNRSRQSIAHPTPTRPLLVNRTAQLPKPAAMFTSSPIFRHEGLPHTSSAAHSSPRSAAAQYDMTSVSKRRLRESIDSPTVQFLKNPFPAPLPRTLAHSPVTSPSSAAGIVQSSHPTNIVLPLALEDLYAYNHNPDYYFGRKRARVWFTKSPAAVTPYRRHGFELPSSPKTAFEKIRHSVTPAAPARSSNTTSGLMQRNATATKNQTATSPAMSTRRREAAVAPSPVPTPAVAEEREDEHKEDSDSEYDEDILPAGKRQKTGRSGSTNQGSSSNKPGAALRTTIACTELRNAFLANPHPPTSVLDSLASRLGLGKSESCFEETIFCFIDFDADLDIAPPPSPASLPTEQVSNYFVRERKKAGYQIKVRHGINRRSNKLGKKASKAAAARPQGEPKERDDQEQQVASDMEAEQVDRAEDDEGQEEEEEEQSVIVREASVSTEATEEVTNDAMDLEDSNTVGNNFPVPVYSDQFHAPAHIVMPTTLNSHSRVVHHGGGGLAEDDVPELAYDDVASLRSENLNINNASANPSYLSPTKAAMPGGSNNTSSTANADSVSSLLMLASKSNDGSVVSSVSDDVAIMSPPNPVFGLPAQPYHSLVAPSKGQMSPQTSQLGDLPFIA